MDDERTHMDGEPEATSATRDEDVTSPEIKRGTVIGLTKSSNAWTATIELEPELENTPMVEVPEVPRHDSNAPRAWTSEASAEATTRRWISPSSMRPPPIEIDVAPELPPTVRESALARSGLTIGAVSGLAAIAVFWALHGSPRATTQGPSAGARLQTQLPATAGDTMEIVDSTPDTEEVPAPPPAPPPVTLDTVELPVTPAAGSTSASPRHTDRLALAHDALVHGRLHRAESYYAELEARDPRDVEAIAGVGDVERARGNFAAAETLYSNALAISPAFLPARLGLADTHWDSGSHMKAIAEYRAILESYAHVPAYVTTRAKITTNAAPAAKVTP